MFRGYAEALMDFKILKYGNPLLYQKSKKVYNPTSFEVKKIIKSMKKIIEKLSASGIAAPQIGFPLAIAIFKVPKETDNPKYALTPEFDPNGVDLTEMINPSYKPLSEEMQEEWEGCLSIPGMLGLTPRYLHIEYAFQDLSGRTLIRKASGFHARIIQHEVDHLEGILFPSKITGLKNFGYADEIIQTEDFKKLRNY